MSKRRHNFGTKRFKEKSLFIFHARIALKSLILLFVRLIARGAKHTHRHTDRHTERTSTVTLAHARRGLTSTVTLTHARRGLTSTVTLTHARRGLITQYIIIHTQEFQLVGLYLRIEENFRMRRQTFNYICDKLPPSICRQNTRFRSAIDVERRVAITLWCLASCNAMQISNCCSPLWDCSLYCL